MSNCLERYKFLATISTLLFLIYTTNAQTVFLSNARSYSLGGCSILLQDMGSFFTNPAIMTTQKTLSTSCNYENNYFISDLQKSSIAIGTFSKFGYSGLGFRTYGVKSYKLLEFSIGHGIKLNENFSFGTKLIVNNCTIQGYGNRYNLGISFGIYGKLGERLYYASVFEQNGNNSSNQARIPSKINIGLHYIASNTISCYSEIEKILGYPIRLKVACEYFLSPVFPIRMGIANSGYLFCVGFGYILKSKYRIDVGSSWQPILGTSIFTGFVYSLSAFKKHE